MGLSVLIMALGAGFAMTLYSNGFSVLAKNLQARFPKAHNLLSNKYYVDEFYASAIVQPLRDMSQFMWRISMSSSLTGSSTASVRPAS